MMRNQLSDSAYQAQAILGAWNSGDTKLFCEELDRVGCSAMQSDESEETERMELLLAIAADLRVPSIPPLADNPGNIYADLLRHLAFSHRLIEGNSASKPSTANVTERFSQKEPAVVLQ